MQRNFLRSVNSITGIGILLKGIGARATPGVLCSYCCNETHHLSSGLCITVIPVFRVAEEISLSCYIPTFNNIMEVRMVKLHRVVIGVSMFLIVTLAALGACSNPVGSTDQGPAVGATATPTPAAPSPLVDPALPTAVAGQPEWEYQREATGDFDGDGATERAMLIAHVQLAADGRPVWDDRQPWQLYIEEPDTSRTYVYARSVQLGRVEAIVTQAASDQLPTIVLIEQTPQQLIMYEITYRDVQQVEVNELVRRSLDANGFAGTPN